MRKYVHCTLYRLENKYMYVCHAEMNAIMNKNSASVEGCSMFVALFPCNECAKVRRNGLLTFYYITLQLKVPLVLF